MFPVSRADSAIPPRDRMSQWFRPLRAGRWRFFHRQIGKRSGDWVIGKAKAHRGDAEARRGPGLNRGSTRMSADQEEQNLPLMNTDHPA